MQVPELTYLCLLCGPFTIFPDMFDAFIVPYYIVSFQCVFFLVSVAPFVILPVFGMPKRVGRVITKGQISSTGGCNKGLSAGPVNWRGDHASSG